MLMISCSAFAGHDATHYFFETPMGVDTDISPVDGTPMPYQSPEIMILWGDSITCSHILAGLSGDTVFIGIGVDTDSTIDAIVADGNDTTTCEGAKTNAKNHLGINNIRFICD